MSRCPSGSFDLAISECGASLWCDPARWVPEAARLLRPGGKLAFHTTTILVTVCSPGLDGPAGQELLHPQRQAHRLVTPREGYSSTPATASGSRSCAAAASSSTRCTNCTPRQMLPIIPTTHWRAPDGPVASRGKMGCPPRRLTLRDQECQSLDARSPTRRFRETCRCRSRERADLSVQCGVFDCRLVSLALRDRTQMHGPEGQCQLAGPSDGVLWRTFSNW